MPALPLFRDIEAWQDYLKVQGFAEDTRVQYRRTLVRVIADTLEDPRCLDERDVVSYLASLGGNGHARGAVLRALKSFCGWDGRDPTSRLAIPRPKYPPAPYLTDSELLRVLVAAAWREERRAWAILLCVTTGARIGSLIHVRPSDAKDGRVLFRVAKGDRPYTVPLPEPGRIAVVELNRLREGGAFPAQARRRGTLIGVGRSRFEQWVQDAEHDSGVRVWPHLLRHTFGTKVYRATKDPLVLKRLLNHADLSQIPRYAAVTDDDATDAVRAAWG